MHWIGLLNIYKIPGMSSHEVVSRVRRIVGMKRVGHTGTLDPAACGVLIVCLGAATRLADYVAAGPKTYRAEITLGVTTACDDAEGEILAYTDTSHISQQMVEAILPRFTGVLQQCPPQHSAVQIGGIRSYDLARRGITVALALRKVTIYYLTLLRFIPGPKATLLLEINCSKGTYIRSLARDIGEALAVGGVLSFLARTQAGQCTIDSAVTLDELALDADNGEFSHHLQPPDAPLDFLPAINLPAEAHRYYFGTEVPLDVEPGLYRVYWQNEFLGLGKAENGHLRPSVHLKPDQK